MLVLVAADLFPTIVCEFKRILYCIFDRHAEYSTVEAAKPTTAKEKKIWAGVMKWGEMTANWESRTLE